MTITSSEHLGRLSLFSGICSPIARLWEGKAREHLRVWLLFSSISQCLCEFPGVCFRPILLRSPFGNGKRVIPKKVFGNSKIVESYRISRKWLDCPLFSTFFNISETYFWPLFRLLWFFRGLGASRGHAASLHFCRSFPATSQKQLWLRIFENDQDQSAPRSQRYIANANANSDAPRKFASELFLINHPKIGDKKLRIRRCEGIR